MTEFPHDPPAWICPTCGQHYPPASSPPDVCLICADERQWIPPTGQQWTTLHELAEQGFRTELAEVEPDLLGIGVNRPLGVSHRGLLVRTPTGNVLWDPPAFLDAAAVNAVREAGGVHTVSSSHPHMYGAMVEWSRIFQAEILLPEVDLGWMQRRDPAVRAWSGLSAPLPGITLIQCGGHFPGSAALHWEAGAGGAGVLLVGDTVFVTPGEDRVSFAWSAPNRLPMPESGVHGIVRALAPYHYERIYSGWWSPVLRHGAKPTLETSAERYLQFLHDHFPSG